MKNNQNKKRFCSVLLAVFVFVMCMFSVYAFADNNEQTTAETSVSEQAKTDTEAVSASDDVAKTDEAASDETSEDIGGEETEKPGLFGTPWSLLAPVIAIALALITKEVYSSLFIGIVAGALLSADFKPIAAMDNILNQGFIAAVSGTAGIFIFLVVLGILVALINKSGGSAAFGAWAERNIKTRIGAILSTFVLGVLIFIDDYFNCLTVGSVMLPITDKHKVSRAKLSYLIDATAAPVCMIAPISSWAAAVSSYAPEGQGLSLFIKAIPYNFYSLLTFVFIIAITFMKFDYGPMKLHEYNAINKGDLFTNGSDTTVTETEHPSQRGMVIDLVLPVVILIIVCVLSLIYVGGFFSGSSFVDAFANTDATVGLPWGGIVVLVLTIIYMVARRTVTFKEAMDCIPKGFIAMVPAILILTFATTLKNMTGLMGSDIFVKNFMANTSSLNHFVPAIIFLVAIGISFATGTSWGTFGILIPIVIGIFPDGSELLIISMSACLAGSICGDHCSPISDTTIMSSAGARCNHINHVSTQLPYAITVAVVSFVTYLIAGFVNSWYIVLPIGAVLMIVTLFAIKAATSKKQA